MDTAEIDGGTAQLSHMLPIAAGGKNYRLNTSEEHVETEYHFYPDLCICHRIGGSDIKHCNGHVLQDLQYKGKCHQLKNQSWSVPKAVEAEYIWADRLSFYKLDILENSTMKRLFTIENKLLGLESIIKFDRI